MAGNYVGVLLIPSLAPGVKNAPPSRIITPMLQTRSFTIHLTPPTLTSIYLREPQARTLHRLAVGLAISLCIHVLLLVFAPKRDVSQSPPVDGTQGPLVVRLTSPSKAAPPPSAAEATPQKPTPRPPASQQPRMMTAPSATPQRTPQVAESSAPARAVESEPNDFMSMIIARRAQRLAAEAAAGGRGREPTADEIAMANINRNTRSLTQRDGTSGVFQILSKGHRAAQFSFNGWTGDRSNSRRDVIEVDAGLNGNIEIAIIRRMIELIRTHYKGDFNWDSHRLGRVVVLSARVEDTAGLEEFMMREFF